VTDLRDIIEGCKRNDRASQEKLYRQFYPGLFAFCRRFFEDRHDVITALNNGMLNVFKNIGQYDPTKGELFNWAYTIVRNAAITHLKTLKSNGLMTEMTLQVEQSVSYSPFEELMNHDIYVYLDKLPPATRAVCILHYLENYAVKEIAEELKLSEGTVKWHLSECRNRLKSYFTNPSYKQK
jgi:RNA polymerase sigma factor (sigma-70 family)